MGLPEVYAMLLYLQLRISGARLPLSQILNFIFVCMNMIIELGLFFEIDPRFTLSSKLSLPKFRFHFTNQQFGTFKLNLTT